MPEVSPNKVQYSVKLKSVCTQDAWHTKVLQYMCDKQKHYSSEVCAKIFSSCTLVALFDVMHAVHKLYTQYYATYCIIILCNSVQHDTCRYCKAHVHTDSLCHLCTHVPMGEEHSA